MCIPQLGVPILWEVNPHLKEWFVGENALLLFLLRMSIGCGIIIYCATFVSRIGTNLIFHKANIPLK